MKTISSLQHNLLALVLGTAGVIFLPALVGGVSSSAHAASVAGLPDFAELVEKAGPAVVNIRTTEKVRPGQGVPGGDDEEMQEFFRRFFGVPIPPRQQPDRPQRGRKQ